MAIPIVATGLFSFLGTLFGKFLTDGLLRYIAYKALAVSLIIITFPIILKNLIVWIFEEVTQVVNANMAPSSLEPVLIELTDLGAWFADCFMLADCLALVLTALVIRLVLNFIPFVG